MFPTESLLLVHNLFNHCICLQHSQNNVASSPAKKGISPRTSEAPSVVAFPRGPWTKLSCREDAAARSEDRGMDGVYVRMQQKNVAPRFKARGMDKTSYREDAAARFEDGGR
eukprot:1162053-Pelagomonas_calceolata.AAC.7